MAEDMLSGPTSGPKLSHKIAAQYREILDGRAEIKAKVSAVPNDISEAENADDLVQQATIVADNIGLVATTAEAELKAASSQQARSVTSLRRHIFAHGITRACSTPDPIKTLQVMLGFVLVEAIAAGAMFISEGRMGPIEGLMMGMATATTTVSVMFTSGFFFARRITYKLNSPEPSPQDVWVRAGGLFGTLCGIAIAAVLLFAAARTRILGSHEHVFDFSQVGLADTFSDAVSLLIMAFGMVGGIVAFWEGITGIFDPIIGYSQAWNAATSTTAQRAEDICFDAQDNVDAQAEDILEALERSRTEAKDNAREHENACRELGAEIERHNANVEATICELRADLEQAATRREEITKRPHQAALFDEASFEALKIAPDSVPELFRAQQPTDQATRLQQAAGYVRQAQSQAHSTINSAYSQFLSNGPDIDVFNDE
nr:hypothetical protein [uncultured Hyphomonas sp.]